ncbi:hypothetical protein RRF57_008112 [Xylaria bambusicola]|uniref:Myb-like domain-containing protein n=1 Tax=Xylaria bambusicola TaxID=326684 RepID=A0AAN7UM94_9PEZI
MFTSDYTQRTVGQRPALSRYGLWVKDCSLSSRQYGFYPNSTFTCLSRIVCDTHKHETMSTRRTRAASRREESPESLREAPAARQTRSNSKRAGPPSDASPQSKPAHPRIPQRGTRRRRRRSLESVATNDFPKSSAEHASPDPPVMDAETTESLGAEHVVVVVVSSDTESQDAAYERLQDLLDFDLPKLSRWCDRVFDALTSLTLPEPTIEQRKKLKTARKYFNLARRPLAEASTAYIDLASSNLPYRDDPHTRQRAQKFTRKANLISLLLSIHDLNKPEHDATYFIQTLDEQFPLCLDPDSPYFEGYSLAYRVRCRRLIELLEEESKADPLVVATTLFCQQPASTSEEAMERLREGPFRIFGHEGQEGYTSSREFKTEMVDLVSKLSLPTRAEIEQTFDETYSRDELFKNLRLFASDVYLYLNEKVDEGDPQSNSQKDDEVNDGDEPREQEGSFVSDDRQSNDGSDSDSSSEHEYHQLKTMTKEPSFIQGPSTLAAVRQSEGCIAKHPEKEQLLQQKTAKGKMTESQITDAIRRLNPAEVLGESSDEDDEEDIVPTGSRAAEPRSRSGSQELGVATKRTRPEEDDAIVDDYDDFEVNEQVINESRRHRYDDPDIARPVPKRSRFSADLGKNGGRAQSPNATPAGTNLTNDDLVTLSRAARANKLAHKGRTPQVREKWSSADTNRLLDLIADPDINCSWSEMERRGGFQTHRNQQAIRDKARNLKKGYLCADAILPSGFDLVSLSKKEKNDVIASGHNPDRMENDIDERGRVIRNLWKDR